MNLAALVLAAGAGRRFGGGKLVAPFRGEPLLSHAIRAARAAPGGRVIVVAAPDLVLPADVEPIRLTSTALSASLQAGIAAAGPVDGLFVFLGDMPLVPHRLAGELAALLPGAYAVQPRYHGQPGHPVLLSAHALADCADLHGDEGFGRLLRGRSDVAFVECADEGVVADIDRAEDIARLEGMP